MIIVGVVYFGCVMVAVGAEDLGAAVGAAYFGSVLETMGAEDLDGAVAVDW